MENLYDPFYCIASYTKKFINIEEWKTIETRLTDELEHIDLFEILLDSLEQDIDFSKVYTVYKVYIKDGAFDLGFDCTKHLQGVITNGKGVYMEIEKSFDNNLKEFHRLFGKENIELSQSSNHVFQMENIYLLDPKEYVGKFRKYKDLISKILKT